MPPFTLYKLPYTNTQINKDFGGYSNLPTLADFRDPSKEVNPGSYGTYGLYWDNTGDTPVYESEIKDLRYDIVDPRTGELTVVLKPLEVTGKPRWSGWSSKYWNNSWLDKVLKKNLSTLDYYFTTLAERARGENMEYKFGKFLNKFSPIFNAADEFLLNNPMTNNTRVLNMHRLYHSNPAYAYSAIEKAGDLAGEITAAMVAPFAALTKLLPAMGTALRTAGESILDPIGWKHYPLLTMASSAAGIYAPEVLLPENSSIGLDLTTSLGASVGASVLSNKIAPFLPNWLKIPLGVAAAGTDLYYAKDLVDAFKGDNLSYLDLGKNAVKGIGNWFGNKLDDFKNWGSYQREKEAYEKAHLKDETIIPLSWDEYYKLNFEQEVWQRLDEEPTIDVSTNDPLLRSYYNVSNEFINDPSIQQFYGGKYQNYVDRINQQNAKYRTPIYRSEVLSTNKLQEK